MTALPELLPGHCHRCGEPGHWANACGWLQKAASKAEHESRIAAFVQRYWDQKITEWQKREFIRDENKLWYDGKVPSGLA